MPRGSSSSGGSNTKKKATSKFSSAEGQGEIQRQKSPAEFFADNQAIAGFDNHGKSLYTSIRELIENSLVSTMQCLLCLIRSYAIHSFAYFGNVPTIFLCSVFFRTLANRSGCFLRYKFTSKNSIKSNSTKYAEFLLIQRTQSSLKLKVGKEIMLLRVAVEAVRKSENPRVALLVIVVQPPPLPRCGKKQHGKDTFN